MKIGARTTPGLLAAGATARSVTTIRHRFAGPLHVDRIDRRHVWHHVRRPARLPDTSAPHGPRGVRATS